MFGSGHAAGKASLFLILNLCFSSLGQATVVEQFDEELTIRPLRDGKVASRFSFRMLLKGVTPRNPQTLGLEDDCASCSRSNC
jgi:phosphatidylinositol glycan class T